MLIEVTLYNVYNRLIKTKEGAYMDYEVYGYNIKYIEDGKIKDYFIDSTEEKAVEMARRISKAKGITVKSVTQTRIMIGWEENNK